VESHSLLQLGGSDSGGQHVISGEWCLLRHVEAAGGGGGRGGETDGGKQGRDLTSVFFSH